MKQQYYSLFLFLLLLSCKKEPQTVAAVKYTAVSGHVYNGITGLPMANVNMGINRLLQGWLSFAALNEDKIIASVYTNDSGYFQMSFPDTIPADNFVVVYLNPNIYAVGNGGMYIVSNTNRTIALDQANVFTIYMDTIPLLYLHLHIINNHDSVEIIPNSPLMVGNFYIYPATFDTSMAWEVYPNTSYQLLDEYDEGRDTMYEQLQNINIGNYQDTFQRSYTVDASTFTKVW